jgi:hypothetical protein
MAVHKERQYCPEDDAMVLAERQAPNHILHLLLTVFTAGLWLIAWLLVVATAPPFRCPRCGARTSRHPPRGWATG